MNKIFILLFSILLLFTFDTNAQVKLNIKGVVTSNFSTNDRTKIRTGSTIILTDIIKVSDVEYQAYILYNGVPKVIKLKHLEFIKFNVDSIYSFWINQAIKKDVYYNLVKHGMKYELRKELEEDALEYIQHLKTNNLIFYDAYLEDYIYTLAYKIYPNKINDGRPGSLNIVIIKDIVPNAFSFSNGTLCITTGLLSTLNTENELIAVLSQEISHFVLDHSVENVLKLEKREKRAMFWASLVTAAAVVGDVYASTKSSYYTPGMFSASTALLSFSIAKSINERLGLEMNIQQEIKADNCATELLTFLKINQSALISSFEKLQDYYINSGNYFELTEKGSNPLLDSRLVKLKKKIKSEIVEENHTEYDVIISFVNTFNAMMELENKHIRSCNDLIERNISAGVATEEDYVLLAMTRLYMYDTEFENLKTLKLLEEAENINVMPSLNLFKQKTIVHLRLGSNDIAANSMNSYISELNKEKNRIKSLGSNLLWNSFLEFYQSEYEWSVKMLNKIEKMKNN